MRPNRKSLAPEADALFLVVRAVGEEVEEAVVTIGARKKGCVDNFIF
jgi:hypothetical protein